MTPLYDDEPFGGHDGSTPDPADDEAPVLEIPELDPEPFTPCWATEIMRRLRERAGLR